MSNAATPPAALRVGSAAILSKPPPNATQASSSLRLTSSAASTVAAPPHRAIPCFVLFSPQGPHPLEGLKTVTLERLSDGAVATPRRGSLRTRGSSLNRLPAGVSLPLSASTMAARHRTAKHVTASAAARASHQSTSGIRCVYDRDTRSQLLHITPGTEVDFSSCMRLPALATKPAPVVGAAATPMLFAATAVHTIVVVQFCVAAPVLSPAARHQAGAPRPQLPASPIPPPGSFHIELVLRTGTSANTVRGRNSASGSSSSGSSGGGYRLRFTNTGSGVQRHTHHTKIPLLCVRTAQWVQLFLDLEALLQSCQEAGAVIIGGGPHCRLQQLRIGSGGSAASTGGIYVRRIIAGHGLALPHPVIDHLITSGGVPGVVAVVAMPSGGAPETFRDADGEGQSSRRNSGTLQQFSSGGGSSWAPPEALRLPAEAGESLCVFVRTGEEYILSEAPALPTPTEEPSPEDVSHVRERDDSVGVTQLLLKASNCAGDVGRSLTECAEAATQGAARRRPAQAVKATATKPLTSPLSSALPPPQPQRRQLSSHQQQSPASWTSYQGHPDGGAAAVRAFKSQPRSPRVPHCTALELLRMHNHRQRLQPQPVHQFAVSGAATHTPSPADPPSPFFPFSASPLSSPVDASSLSVSDDAEMFVVREVSAAEQLAPATPPQYPANQLMTGKPPLCCPQSQPPIAEKVTHHALDAGPTGEAAVVQHERENVALEDADGEGFSTCPAAAATGFLFSSNTSTITTTTTASEASVLSVVSYSSAVELMDEMNERVRRIHTVLAGAEEEAAAAAAAVIVDRSLARGPPSRHFTPPPTAQGGRPAASTSALTALPLLEPPPLTDAAAIHSSSPPPSAPATTTPADFMKGALDDTLCDAVVAAAAVLNTPPKSPTATAKSDGVGRVAVEDHTPRLSPTSDNTKAVLELWSSTEMPLYLPSPSQRPATAAVKGASLMERLRERQATLSSSSSAASVSPVNSGDNGGLGDAPSGAMLPPTSAVTSWTFHSASLTPQSPSILRLPTARSAGEGLPGAGGAPSNHATGAERGEEAPPLWPLSELRTTAPEGVAAVVPSSRSSAGQVMKAVVWRRPVPVPGHPPSIGDATQRALQDEVRLTDTPLSRRAGAPEAESGDARRMVAWSARQNAGTISSGMHTPLSAAVASKLGVAPQQESCQGFIEAPQLCIGAQVPPLLPNGRSFSTVSSFQMWLPSSPMPTLSEGRGRYPSTTTPSSGGGDQHGGFPSNSSSGVGSGPPRPQLGVAAVLPSARPPLPPPSVVHMPQAAPGLTAPTSSSGAAMGLLPLAQQQQQTLGLPAATWTRCSPHHASVSPPEAPPNDGPLSAQLGNDEGRYLYDCVLQCYLDLARNTYVDKI
ncbi:conserved hypothetical protein [Leishmania braziliensis MHOM/BR/75/M2904]|uniref:Uncharacterized protein n=2 Tax=Leishmania braziliensis TaxID=5660 RepID=A4H8X4_LEIBR|nr:conserved hypothetical protein [Leishmania braziliensis MHOM/BR/75/M2904]CAJ2470002.1 unnamed protein product [Leishmania braziliensis]CAJ2470509.1 unnamed protein product [Leishmania braziliensis]CAM37842.2 conserved hypothetical protein [Leishmania braziliensis MHOM/BR/75/M2904]SYZ64511.1 hypothetical_protein [Leishmania braziliensis MHOM/BR/75/M2904]